MSATLQSNAVSNRPSRRRSRSAERGYAYLLALLMVMALIVSSQVLLENLATQGRRMREQETIWRGEQCERAIRLYYHKTGHYPQTFDDLESGLPELHFLRGEAEKNPMNETDGTWRFIYVNAAGQIIGSVKYATLQQMALIDLNHGKLPPAALPGAVSAASLASGNANNSATAPTGQQPGTSSELGQPTNPLAELKPTGPVDGPVVGGFLTGVAGKTDQPSLIVYGAGKKYLDWEFIWNPIEDRARALQQAGGSQGAIPGLPSLPIGTGGIGLAPQTNPGAPGTSPSSLPVEPSNPGGVQPSPGAPPQDSQ
jgi:hypothetical protein